MKLCEVCGKPIPRTKKVCEECESGVDIGSAEEEQDEFEETDESEEEF